LKIIKKLNQDLIFYFPKKNFSLDKNSFHVERDSKIFDFSIIANNFYFFKIEDFRKIKN
jgi:hypothetical protein